MFDLVNIYSVLAGRSIIASGKVTLVRLVVEMDDIHMFTHTVSVHKPLRAAFKGAFNWLLSYLGHK